MLQLSAALVSHIGDPAVDNYRAPSLLSLPCSDRFSHVRPDTYRSCEVDPSVRLLTRRLVLSLGGSVGVQALQEASGDCSCRTYVHQHCLCRCLAAAIVRRPLTHPPNDSV